MKKVSKRVGLVEIYTGDGKGKTTAALGLAFRALGHGIRTYIGQFMKGYSYGEVKALKFVKPYIKIEKYGKKGFIHVKKEPEREDIELARKGLEKAKKALYSGKYGIVILDEAITALFFNLLKIDDLIDFIRNKPKEIELVLTGRYAPQRLIEEADLVTEMKEIKHPYRKGVKARKGIEF